MCVDIEYNGPCVSVLMTAYNSEEFIGEAISSVLAQSFIDFELIIVDDDSSDSTFRIASEFASRDNRISVYKNVKNVGDYKNRSIAATYASGRYLKYLDSDNYLYPHALDVLVSSMDKFPDAGLGLCKLHDISHPLPDILSPNDAYREGFLKAGLFTNAPSSTIIKSQVYNQVGGFANTRHRGDYELWLKLAAAASVVRIPGFLDWSRVHLGQESHKNSIVKVSLTYNITMKALSHKDCPLVGKERIDAIQWYRKRFLINTFIKRFVSGDLSVKNLIDISRSLDMKKKDLFCLFSRRPNK